MRHRGRKREREHERERDSHHIDCFCVRFAQTKEGPDCDLMNSPRAETLP